MRGLVTAFRTLTILQVPGCDSERMEESLPFFPFVGGVIGALVAGIAWLVGGKCGWPDGAGILCVVFSSLLTRGIHLDGLADTFDSLGGWTVQRRLEIMKDSHVGSFGVIALVLVLAAKVAAISRLAGYGEYLLLVVPFIVSRMMQVHLIVALPYARAEGGTARKFVEGAKAFHLIAAYIAGLLLCFALGNLVAILVVGVASLSCIALASFMRSTFGGVTGDLIGMGSELFEAGTLVGLVFLV